jgi:hypothetical protein
LRNCHARYPVEPVAGEASPPVEIKLADGTQVRSDTSEAATQLSALLGRSVSLRSMGRAGSATEPRLTMDMETPETVRA